jgi:hypothetical protein
MSWFDFPLSSRGKVIDRMSPVKIAPAAHWPALFQATISSVERRCEPNVASNHPPLHNFGFLMSASRRSSEASDGSVGSDRTGSTEQATTEQATGSNGCGGSFGLNSTVQPKDVLCGRDRRAHNHPGNKRFRSIVQSYRERYQSAPRREDKNRITNEIIQRVLREGGRFLRLEEETGQWVLVDASGAHDKVSHALRSAKEPRRTRGVISEDGELSFATPHEQSKFRKLSSMQQSIFEELMKSEQLNDEAGVGGGGSSTESASQQEAV